MEQKNLEKVYNPKDFEEKIYQMWSENGYFTADSSSKKPPFSVVIPPPNVTGQLHMGHALNVTLQDILVRYKRMAGYETLWVPGYDHAGIATQIKVEEVLWKEEGLTRYDLGREKFLERVWDWKNKYGSTIVNQIKRMGCSCDWSRERFTMDEGCSKAVRRVFVDLYQKGLIYQGSRIINWCPKCITALSDAEVEYEEQAGHFWHIKYPVKDSDEFVVLATTRPETLLGDTAVAVNPNDDRYRHLVGKMLILPLVGREIPVIADDYVDMEFGTGVVKITPAHDPNDFEVGLRHHLEQIKVLNDDATINEYGGKYEGLDRYEARKQMVADLDAQGLLVKVEEHAHNVGQCYRCGTTVEPITSKQWFVKMEPLAKEALRVVRDGTISFIPDRFSKIYLNWMENVHDWCISRQLWWGHRIPAFYCQSCGHTAVSETDLTSCPKCGGAVKQDEDVLDTWFSSALWPFSTLGWPEETADLEKFYPTSVLVTAYDIIFFWVARMIFSGMEHRKEIPFKHVFIHGIVRDEQGRKMSKSLGNGIDPLKLIDEYGTDALRFTLVTGNSPGNDIRFSWDRVQASRNFANKIWNASRFVLMNLKPADGKKQGTLPCLDELQTEDKWILSRLQKVAGEVNDNLNKYELGVASAKLYDFIWDEFCDWYIELVKPRLYGEDEKAAQTAERVLCWVLSNTMCLLHPFMPFITEEIWQCLPHEEEGSVMVQPYPQREEGLIFEKEEKEMEQIMQMIRSIRNLRAEMNVPPSRKAQVMIVADRPEEFENAAPFFERLASASGLQLVQEAEIPEDTVSVVIPGAKAFLPLGELVDKQKELERLQKELERLSGEIKRVEGKLANESFVAKAPAHLVQQEREKKVKFEEMLRQVQEGIEKMK